MSQAQPSAMVIHRDDSVAVALREMAVGETFSGIALCQPIGRGHKFALRAHAAGDQVFKYGQPIGRTTGPVAPGEHVHVHNLRTDLAGELTYLKGSSTLAGAARAPQRSWQGYRRGDGQAATRNEVWILPTVGCVAQTAEEAARAARERHQDRIDGIYAFPHPHGCSQLGDDLSGTRQLLAGLVANPNAAGVLLLGLGCESNQLDALVAAVPEAARGKLRVLSSQSAGDELAACAALIDELVDAAAEFRREPLPLSALAVGLKCGGSDALSGLTANPLLGRLTDALCAADGRAILTEIPEVFGAEQALLDRAIDRQVFDAAAELINGMKRYFLEQGLPVSENPSPGNIAGGITTLEEKSLGAVQKGGQAALVDVLLYGGQIARSGLSLLESPGNDAVSATALAAAGATMVLFTTGRGTPLGFPVPTVKVASNRALAEAKPHWIDFDASVVLEQGQGMADETFLARILAVASGEKTAAERAGQRAIAIWKRGVTL